MTNNLTIRSLDIPNLHKFSVGFDSIFDELRRLSAIQSQTNYPPYNVIKHSDDNYTIEMAVAGFTEDDITVELSKNVLSISGEKTVEQVVGEYAHQGISSRSFSRQWPVAEYVEVVSAVLKNGILSVNLVRNVPEEQKPKRIQITTQK